MFDLFAAAAQNGLHLAREFQEVVAGTHPEAAKALLAFASEVAARGRMSVSVRQPTLNDFLSNGTLENAYEQADRAAALAGRDRDEVLQETWDAYYLRRRAFDAVCDGAAFRYAALSIGGMGAWHYGEYAVILGPSVPHPGGQVAYLPEDSLRRYVAADGTVDIARLAREVGPHAHRHELAAVRIAPALTEAVDAAGSAAATRDAWPKMLCDNNDVVEIIYTGPVRPEDVEAVRVERTHGLHLFDLAFFARLRGVKRGSAEWYIGGTFRTIVRRLDELGAPLEMVS